MNSAPASSPPASTPRDLHRRFTTVASRKARGISAGMTVFFVLYFLVQNHPLFPVTILAESRLDHLISFQPSTSPSGSTFRSCPSSSSSAANSSARGSDH